MENFGFDLGKYVTVDSIPVRHAKFFYQQVRVMLWDRKVVRAMYDTSFKFTKFAETFEDEAEEEIMKHDLATANDSDGNLWRMGIIAQRIHMKRDDERRANEIATAEADREREIEWHKREQCEAAMERTAEREKEIEKARVQRLVRLSKARAVVQKEVRVIRQRERHEADIEAGLKAQKQATKTGKSVFVKIGLHMHEIKPQTCVKV